MLDFMTKIIVPLLDNVSMMNFISKIIGTPQGNTNKLSKRLPDGLIVSLVGPYIISPEGLRILRLIKLSPEELIVSSSGIKIGNHT